MGAPFRSCACRWLLAQVMGPRPSRRPSQLPWAGRSPRRPMTSHRRPTLPRRRGTPSRGRSYETPDARPSCRPTLFTQGDPRPPCHTHMGGCQGAAVRASDRQRSATGRTRNVRGSCIYAGGKAGTVAQLCGGPFGTYKSCGLHVVWLLAPMTEGLCE